MDIDLSVQQARLSAVADAIRAKDGTADAIAASDFPARIRAIPVEYPEISLPLTVTMPAGTAVTAVHGSTTLTAVTGEDGTAVLYLTEPGEWTVTAGPDGAEQTTTVTVPDGLSETIRVFSDVPDGYTQVEYVDLGASTRITPGIPMRFTTYRGALTAALPDGASAGAFLGAYNYTATSSSSSSTGFYDYLTKDVISLQSGAVKLESYYKQSPVSISPSTVPSYSLPAQSGKMVIAWDPADGKFSVNDAVTDYTAVTGSYGSRAPTIGCINYYSKTNHNGSATQTYTSFLPYRFYELALYDADGAALYRFVPAIRDSDGRVGLFELVNGSFILPDAGELTAGPAVL